MGDELWNLLILLFIFVIILPIIGIFFFTIDHFMNWWLKTANAYDAKKREPQRLLEEKLKEEINRNERIEKDRQAEVKRIEDDKNAWGELYERKLQIEANLQTLSDDQLHLFDAMPPVKAYLVKEPIHSNESSSSAYARGDKEVFFKYEYYENADMNSLIYVMKHEMTHNWIHWKGIKMDDPHGQAFQDKLNQVL